MNCMKCGREIPDEGVFCENCLEEMKKYPVNDGTAILLPIRKDSPAARKARAKRRPPTAEERVVRLRRRLSHVVILWLITLALLTATIYPTVSYFVNKTILRPGQNYKTITSSISNTTEPN